VSPYVPPVVIYGREGLIESEGREIRRLARSSRVRLAPTRERLLDEVVLLLHRAEDQLSTKQREILSTIREHDLALVGRKLLVVDDDVRNIFALTSVLEDRHLTVLHAEDGRTGIQILESQSGIDAVLMDIMMPEMDGYQTIGAIRQIERFANLPIIALTAKAMKGDREKCLEAGASDYVAKPVDLEQLLSVLRVFMLKKDETRDTANA
jgi:CheY-like chemotaxis protein